MREKSISILGVTGSIGRSTADVILSDGQRFAVESVSTGSRAEELGMMAVKLGAKRAVIADEGRYGVLKEVLFGSGIEAMCGREALIEAAGVPVDVCVAAIVGMAGLEPLMAAVQSSKAVAIANKEPLVAAGEFVLAAAREAECAILPVDSEHNAVFQVFEEQNRAQVRRIILTASGGPFLNWSAEEIANASPAQAVAHPNWSMGAKISVDSASMMNKALEVIEAHVLFDLPPEKIDVMVHPQSAVHSMVEYEDGSVLCQMGASDMRTPIAYSLAWPERMATPGARLDLLALSRLEFFKADETKFPALPAAYECIKGGLNHCIALNAANEIAVGAFLEEKTPFPAIMETINSVLDSLEAGQPASIEDVIDFDAYCRTAAAGYINKTYK